MHNSLLNEMHALLAEGSGDSRTNAATTLSVASIEMAKQVAAMMAASKAFATAVSQLPTVLKAAHEMTEQEVKDFKKLMDQVEVTKTKLKKYVLYAEKNAEVATALASDLKHPGPSGRPGAEPPDDLASVAKAKPAAIPAPTYSANEWQLYSDMPGVAAAAKDLNKALHKAVQKLFQELPAVKNNKSAIDKVLYAAFVNIMAPAMSKHSKFGATDTEPRNLAQQKLSDMARKAVGDSSLDFHNVW